ncbi:unnamed protein product [Rotaria sp. Silwood2]|nr:unnamed protein product [Rotaria sp. Silwood2]
MMIVNHTRANYNNDNQEPVAVNPSTVRSLNRLNRCSTSTPLARIPQCLKEIFRLTEMQSDDYNLDRVLFYACHDDQENLCSQVSSGNGQNYLYLYEKKLNIMMPSAVIY